MQHNERATQTRLLRQLFFSPCGFPEWCLAKNVIPPTAQHGEEVVRKATPHGNIKLTRTWEDSSVGTIQNLQALLMSSKLYQNPVARAALSAGFESGHMRQTTHVEPQRLSKTLTTAAEAHFRMELCYCLSRPCFSHQKSQASHDNCQTTWMEMIPKAWKDRNDNEDAAWGLRVDNLNAEEDSDDNDMDEDSSGGVEGDAADAEKDNAPSFLDPKHL
jgi:hypothetical protein